MRDKNNPQKALIVLIIVFLILFAAGLGSRGITLYQVSDAIFIAPVKKIAIGLRYAGYSIMNARAFFINKKRLLEENEMLVKENRELKDKIAILNGEAMQNKRLKEILNLESYTNYNFTVANVLGTTKAPFNFAIIDKGRKSDIKVGDPVITISDGFQKLVGVIYNISEHSSKVLLLTDPRFFVSVKDAYTGQTGIAQGSGDSMKMLFKIKKSNARIGDPMLTTSLSDIYPQNILVGRIKEIRKVNTVSTLNIIQPSVSFDNLFEVVVIKK